MVRLDYEEIIAIAENPLAEEDPGRPASPESLERVAKMADSLFYQAPFEEQIEHFLHFPPDVSARRLARMSDRTVQEFLLISPRDWLSKSLNCYRSALLDHSAEGSAIGDHLLQRSGEHRPKKGGGRGEVDLPDRWWISTSPSGAIVSRRAGSVGFPCSS